MHFNWIRYHRFHLVTATIALLSMLVLPACGGGGGAAARTEFATKHLSDKTGEQIAETISYLEYPGLDNSEGEDTLQVQLQFERNYRYNIIERINSSKISAQSVQEKLVELYKLPVNDPEGELQTALCPISVMIPPGTKATVAVEWTERWAEGVINEGSQGDGERLGNYEVFLGYIEPCSLVSQDNAE